eukprot:TRINITY_DN9196_c0_g1_i2.p1 TRINITY_DN9196_c0_g1~~TRINITY_DN9196_c0_g1_i2.p1  ORF type:complete len:221 (+),score=60.41 TRINITY_DN9196_c0_g1_i2:82-663(+)
MSSSNEDPELKFYKHREWKPGEDAAPAPVPVKVMNAPENVTPSNGGGSPWNKAGTWEEKSVKSWAEKELKTALVGLKEDMDGEDVVIKEISITGDASLTFIRGKKRYPFDMKIEFTITGPEDLKCTVTMPDFASDEDGPYDTEHKWSNDGNNTLKPKMKEVIGASKKEVRSGKGLFVKVHAALENWIEEFKKL